MSDPVVNVVKCANVVSGRERYCCSVYIPVSSATVSSGVIAKVVEPYEEMGSFVDRIVDVDKVTISVCRTSGSYVGGFADVSVGLFNSEDTVVSFAGRYKAVLDNSLIDVPDCAGAIVVSQGYYFGIRVLMSADSGYTGGVVVNFEFSLIGHSL